MASMNFNFASPQQRTKILFWITSLCSLVYHVVVFCFAFFLKIYPLFYYNIVSISIFAFLVAFTFKFNSLIIPYTLLITEIIVHQVLASYYLGSYCCFYYFILLMGLLPFLFFVNNFKVSVPISTITSIIFILFENMNFPPAYDSLSSSIFRIIRYANISIAIFAIFTMVMVFTMIVFKTEKNLESRNEFLNTEMKLASIVQQSFFKREPIEFENWELSYYNLPMAAVSGDMIDIYHRQRNIDGVGIFDVSGHGLASGLVTMLVKNIIHQEFYKNTESDLAEMLDRINMRIIQEKGEIKNYLTGILIRINGNKLELVNAGHPHPIVYKSALNECFFVDQLPGSFGAIGMDDMPTCYQSQFIELNPGDELILYTDGITDTENELKEVFGKEKFVNSIKQNAALPVMKQTANISNEVSSFRGAAPMEDDITFMIIRRKKTV